MAAPPTNTAAANQPGGDDASVSALTPVNTLQRLGGLWNGSNRRADAAPARHLQAPPCGRRRPRGRARQRRGCSRLGSLDRVHRLAAREVIRVCTDGPAPARERVKQAVPRPQQPVCGRAALGVTRQARQHRPLEDAQLLQALHAVLGVLPGEGRAAGDLVADLGAREARREDAGAGQELKRDDADGPHVDGWVGDDLALLALDGVDDLRGRVQQAEAEADGGACMSVEVGRCTSHMRNFTREPRSEERSEVPY